jgi:hypothetical protein
MIELINILFIPKLPFMVIFTFSNQLSNLCLYQYVYIIMGVLIWVQKHHPQLINTFQSLIDDLIHQNP